MEAIPNKDRLFGPIQDRLYFLGKLGLVILVLHLIALAFWLNDSLGLALTVFAGLYVAIWLGKAVWQIYESSITDNTELRQEYLAIALDCLGKAVKMEIEILASRFDVPKQDQFVITFGRYSSVREFKLRGDEWSLALFEEITDDDSKQMPIATLTTTGIHFYTSDSGILTKEKFSNALREAVAVLQEHYDKRI